MVVSALFKEELGAQSFLGAYPNDARIVHFWIHQQTRLTDGHIALLPDGKPRISVNYSCKGAASDITMRARMDGAMRRDQGGMTIWETAQVKALLTDMQAHTKGRHTMDAFADLVLGPVYAAERQAAERLSIQWDVTAERDIPDAIGLRYQVVQKAEAILNDAGLLVGQDGAVVADDTVAATLRVAEYQAAKSLLMSRLTAEERRYNCQISNG